jgi:hypothetical protein
MKAEDPIHSLIAMVPEEYRLQFVAQLKKVTPEIIHGQIDMAAGPGRMPSFTRFHELLIALITEHCNVPWVDITGPQKEGHQVLARQIFIWAMRTETPMSSSSIGKMIGRDHATVLHSAKKIDELIGFNPGRCGELDQIVQGLNAAGFTRCANRYEQQIAGHAPAWNKLYSQKN